MKLYEGPPDRIRWGRRTVKLNLSFNRVLGVLDILDDERFDDQSKVDFCLSLLCKKKRHPKDPELLTAIFKLLEPERKKKSKGEKVFDYTQDRGLIVAAFWQAYRIDLNAEHDRLHWFTFLDLLQGLPSDTRLSEVISIRTRPMPKPTKHNAEERAQLARLKAEYRLEKSEAEQQNELQAGLRKMAATLLQQARKE